MAKDQTAASYSERLQRVASYIHAHLDEALDLDRLAAIACFSPYHFHRVYRACLGETVAETLARLRLQRAATQLARSLRPVAGIARGAGYGSTPAFSRAFRTSYGYSPGAFRARWRPNFNGGDPMPVLIQTRPSIRVAAVPHQGPPQHIGAAFDRLMAWAGPKGITVPPALGVAVYLSDMKRHVRPPSRRRSPDSTMVGSAVEADETVTIHEVSGGRHAVFLFKGPYAQIMEGYRELFAWLPASGEEPAHRPMFEVNLNDPRTTAPDELLTELCLPLRG